MTEHASRRNVLRGGLVAAGVAVGATGAKVLPGSEPQRVSSADDSSTQLTHPFRGVRQAGVVTEPQPFAAWIGFNLVQAADGDICRRLLRVWTDDIEALMGARAPLTDQEAELAEVASALTVTVAVGAGFYQAAGLAFKKPAWLGALPSFEIDRLKPEWGQSDAVLQVCADSPVAVSHAVRRLIVGSRTLAEPFWVQKGFREPLTRERAGLQFRNLFGQVDGTVQPSTEGTDDGLIWIDRQGPPGLENGSTMVIRRIAMDLDKWDRADRLARENAIGRRLSDGAPLTGEGRGDTPDLKATDQFGFDVIDPSSHLRRARPTKPGERILRRPYSYDDSLDGRADVGLVFVAFQADPTRQFVPIQQRLADADLLNLWTTPIGSAVYAVLPGARDGEVLGQSLFA